MLNIILGRSGYGKTTEVRRRIKQAVQQGVPAVLLVPEQFSFESERSLYFDLGPKANMQVEVFSFTRLCQRLFRAYGVSRRGYLKEGGREILLSLALEETAERLPIYGKSAQKPGFAGKIGDMITEFQQANLSPLALAEKVKKLPVGFLKEKMVEFSFIYEAYHAILERGHADPADDFSIALGLLRENPFFDQKMVFVDEFKGFTAVELEILDEIVCQAQETVVALCADHLAETDGGIGVFSGVREVAARLVRSAKSKGVLVRAPLSLKEPFRFQKPSLRAVEEVLFHQSDKEGSTLVSPEGLKVVSCKNAYGELRYVAAEITRLVREEGYRYRDFAVVGRDLSSYENPIRTLFLSYGVPYFYGVNEPFIYKALPTFVRACLEAALKNYDNESLFRALKTGLLPVTEAEIALLENYVYLWNIKGSLWESDFVQNPRGFADSFIEEDQKMLQELNHTRAVIVSPLEALRQLPTPLTGEDFAKGVYGVLLLAQVDQQIIKQVREEQEEEKREEHRRIWEMMGSTLEDFGLLLRHTALAKGRMVELFDKMLRTLELGHIPQTLDQVLVGDASLVRPAGPRAVFVLGCNEGIFPATPSEGMLLSATEREHLRAEGIALEASFNRQVVDESFIAYKALSNASEGLTLLWSAFSHKGEALVPSSFLSRLSDFLKPGFSLAEEDLPGSFFLQNKESISAEFASHYGENSSEQKTLALFLSEIGEETLEKELKEARNPPPFQLEKKEAKQLFSQNMRLSPSRMEQFYRCPFSYFVQFGLKVKNPRRADWSPLEAGSFVHHALQVLLQKYGGDGLIALSKEEIKEEVERILWAYLFDFLGGQEGKSSRFQYLFTRMKNTLMALVIQLQAEFAQSDFRPADFELPVSQKEGVRPIEVHLPSGAIARVEGVIDRVDLMVKGGKKYVRVVDYKTGAKDFKLSDVYYGINTQMLLYLFSLWQNGRGKYENVIPAGVLYMPARITPVEAERGVDARDLERARQATFSMNGLILNDPLVVSGMDREAEGLFIPAKLDKNGAVKASDAVASLAEMGKLALYVEKLIGDMASALQKGQVEAIPVAGNGGTACDFCAYHSICGHEESDVFRIMEKKKKEDLMEPEKGGGEDEPILY